MMVVEGGDEDARIWEYGLKEEEVRSEDEMDEMRL